MADSRAPRASTDEENAPLLTDPTTPAHTEPTFAERISAILSEPLTALSKVLLVALLVLLLLSSVFIGLFAGAQHKLNKHKGDGGHGGGGGDVITTTATVTTTATGPIPTGKDDTCLTADCIRLSAAILSSIDESYDPCENFYEFANNGWLKQNPLPAGKGVFGSFNALAVENQQFLRELLESDSVPTPSGAISSEDKKYDELLIGKVRGMYKSCMNEDLLDEQDSEPLKKVVKTLRELYHGETLVIKGQEIKQDRNLTAALAYLHSRDIGALFAMEIEGDAVVDPDAMSLWFSQPDLGLPSKEYYDEPAIVALYQTTLERLLVLLDESGNYTLEDVVSFWPAHEAQYEDWMSKEDRSSLKKVGGQAMHKLNTYPLTGLADDDEKEEGDWSWDMMGVVDDEMDMDQAMAIISEVLPSLLKTQDPEDDQDQSWPPWPFPPWDGDDGDKDDKKPKPINYTKLAKSIVKFEKKIANASLDLDILQRDPWITYNPMPLQNLSALLPQVAFNEYIGAFTPRNFAENVIVTYPSYASSLGKLLNETSTDVIEAYLVTRAALSLAPLLGQASEAWQAHRRLVEVLSGIKPGAVADRFEYCVGKVENTLGFAAGRYFVEEKFPGESREKGTKVITDVVKAFKASLGGLEWMDKKSAKKAAQKADALDVKVGYPLSPDTNNARSLLVYYYLVKSDEADFVGNVLSSRASDVYKMWQKLGKRRNKKEWLMYPSQVNAYYNPPANEIVFPAGILQPPFFSQSWPGYLAYGAFGVVAAHELTHAFDSMGRLYNPDGKLEEWWTNSTSEAFKSHEKCIVDQYAGYYVEDAQGNKVYVNGNLTSGENIGDSGIIQAFRAWKAQYEGSLMDGGEFVLPGLPYTKEQLFFIAFGRVWAQNIKPAAAVQRVRTDPHSPNQFRVEGTLRNVPEFAKAFNCSAKARLNPPNKDRCMFWG